MILESASVVLPHAEAERFTARSLQFQGRWRRLRAGLHLPGWPIMLAALLSLGLLLAFYDVVSEAAKKGELRRKASVLFGEATWRCNTAQATSARDSCLLQLKAEFGADTLFSDRGVASALPLK